MQYRGWCLNRGWCLIGSLLALIVLSVAACSRQPDASQTAKSTLEAGAEKLKAKDYAGAEELFKQYINSASSLTQGAKAVLTKYQQEGALEKGYNLIKEFEPRAESLPPVDRGEFYRILGLIAMQSKDTMKDAPNYYAKGSQADPSNHGLLNDYAYSLAENDQDLDKALELVNKAIAFKPNEGNYFDTLGWIYYKQGNYKAALKELLYSLAATGDIAEIRYHIAETYLKLNRLSDAKVELEKALAIDPNFEPAKQLKEKLGQE